MSTVQTWTGAETAILRQALRLSIRRFAELLGVDARTVNKWEARGSTITLLPDTQSILDTALRQADSDVQARFERGIAPRPEGDDTLARALADPAKVDLVAAARLRSQVQLLDERYDSAPSTSLLAETGQCLGQVAFFRAHVTKPRVRRELGAAEAESAILMGQLVWDASQRRDHTTATAYLDQAVGAAREIGDRATESLALLRKSFVALYGRKDPILGLNLTRQTADAADGTSYVLAGLATLHTAEAHAMLGQRRDCEQALAAADRHFDHINDDDLARDLYSPTQPGRLAGSCYLFLDRPQEAQPILEATAHQLRDRSKSQAIVLGNLSLAYLRQRRPDDAAAVLHQAVDVIELTWGGGGLNIVFAACRELQPWRHVPAVQDVYDRVLALMATT
jgi:transcriptional regulator with XRE-family HTH domain